MTVTRSLILIVAAAFCFLVALGCDLSIVHSNESAWRDGGLLAFAASFIP